MEIKIVLKASLLSLFMVFCWVFTLFDDKNHFFVDLFTKQVWKTQTCPFCMLIVYVNRVSLIIKHTIYVSHEPFKSLV